MPDIEIRPCAAADLPAVAGLLRQLEEVAPSQTDFGPDRLAGLLAEMQAAPAFYDNLVACEGGQVVGFISAIYYRTLLHRGGSALINELVVDRARRGAGIGRLLIARVVAEARRRGLDEVEVSTETDNHPAAAFYHKCGFDEEYLLLGMDFA